ncbi:MAG: dihydroorotate dehydrogenase [Candidatus Methanomethylophilaceae archaeon]|nr:dihydroorotate dehydrogenase [Candidatus Methanomethylophilaceae archaeon]
MDLRTSVGSLALDNPCILASGIIDETGEGMARVLRAGAAAVVSKSVGTGPNPGHANPNFIEEEAFCLNAMGLPNPGIKVYAEEMRTAVACGSVIGSVYASSPEEFAELAGCMEDYGACAVELNLSCPHAAGYGMEVGTDPHMVKRIVSVVKDAVSIPVWAKLTPNTHILKDIGKAVEEAGGDAIVAINTLRAMKIIPEFGRPFLSNRFGGLSGSAIRPVGVRAVYDLYSTVTIPIVGVGGICSHRDALEYIMAGASAVQIGTAVLKGLDVFSKVNEGLRDFMREYGYPSVKDMVGVAHE